MLSVKKVLICIILPDFNLMDRYSAVSSVVYSIAHVLQKNDYDVYVNEKSLLQWEERIESTSTVYMPITRFGFVKYFPKRVREIIKDLMYFRKNKDLKNKIIKNPKPDVILSWITIGNSYNVDLAKFWAVPLVSIFDNPLVEEYSFLKGFAPFFKRSVNKHEKRSLAHSKSVIVYSDAVKQYIQKTHSVSPEFYFKAFTDFKRMQYLEVERDSSVINFVYIGSFFNWHKIDDLIEAFNNLNVKHQNCRLYLVGEGPEFERISKSVSNPNIIFTGKLDGKNLGDLIQNMHVGVISNALWFQAPVKLFQYSAASLAVICKNTPTILELTERKKAYTFFESVKELEFRMTFFMENPGKIAEYGTAAQTHVFNSYSEMEYSNFFNSLFMEASNNNIEQKL